MNPNYNAPPINPLPPVVWILVLPMAAVELVLSLSGTFGGNAALGWRNEAIQATAFSGMMWDRMVEVGDFQPRNLLRFVSYLFVHWGAVQALFACVFTLALGKFVGEVYRAWAVIAVFLGSGIVGALAYAVLTNAQLPLVGGYPGAYGLIGAFTFILWTRLGAEGFDRSRAFLFIGALMVYQIVFGTIDLLWRGATDFYWVAELAGFGTGFLLSFVVSPGGWARVLAKIRQR